MNSAHVLIADGDSATQSTFTNSFRDGGFAVSTAIDAGELLVKLDSSQIDLVVMKNLLPGDHSFSLLRQIRDRFDTGVILVSRQNDEVDRIIGLEMGADDFVHDAINRRELIARARSVMRRTRARQPTGVGMIIHFGGMELHLGKRKLIDAEGNEIVLTRGEFDLLACLTKRPGKVLSRDRLLDAVSSREHTVIDRSVDNLISRLRRKIESDPQRPKNLVTVRGVGYQLVGCA